MKNTQETNPLFDKNKTYKLAFIVDGVKLTYTGTQVHIIEDLGFVKFYDKFNEEHVYPLTSLIQSYEIKVRE